MTDFCSVPETFPSFFPICLIHLNHNESFENESRSPLIGAFLLTQSGTAVCNLAIASQSPLIGAFLLTKDLTYIFTVLAHESQSPLIGAFLLTKKMDTVKFNAYVSIPSNRGLSSD